jgi:uncharacterized caspase-like protein
MAKRIALVIGYVLLFLFSPSGLTADAESGEVSSREPFVLELPEVSPARYTLPIVRVGVKDIPSLKIRVLKPFAETINYGAIIVTLNGDGINRGCVKSRDLEGTVVLCSKREDRLGGYTTLPGKNILEISATDRAQRGYYASYVLMLGNNNTHLETSWRNGNAEQFGGRKFAVIVGVSDYKYNDAGLTSLNYADDDARSIADFLKTPEGGGFFPADIQLLVDRDASLTALRSALAETAKRAGRNDMIFIFIAGHGAPDPLSSQNLYFLFHDTKVVDMEKTAFPMNELKLYLDTQVLAERVFVMIDTCHSAGVNQKTRSLVTGRQLIQAGDENNISNFFLTKRLFKEKGRSILTSSDVNEVSRESAKWGNHGVFTWALLEGLKGKADINGDQLITTGEIFQFTRSEVQKATNNEQNPIALPGSAVNLVLAVVKKKPV